jgi:hypothetical protein
MSSHLEKAQSDIEAGKYKAAVKNLWKVQEEVLNGGHIELAPVLLELATTVRDHADGRVKEEADMLRMYAESVT